MGTRPVRRPAVAGAFYQGERSALLRQIESCYRDPRGPGAVPTVVENGPRKLVGLVSPHAGYMYSGPCAAWGMAAVAADGRPAAFVILGPNHGQFGRVNAIQTTGAWSTPLGESPIAEGIATAIADLCPGLYVGPEAFAAEHSLEVQLPFIQHLFGVQTPIVPVMLWDQDAETARAVGHAVARALAGQDALIVASTDMTHYEPAAVAEWQDRVLIERMEALDPDGMLRERQRRGISMCGYGPVAAMLFAALELGATSARTINYTNSGAVGGRAEVVAYLSLGVWRDHGPVTHTR